MPTAALVVHDEPHTRELAVTALRAAFLDVVGFNGGAEWDRRRSRVRVLSPV
jgi:hypothetical protein